MWEDKAAEMLRVIQLNTLEDRSVTDKQHWDAASKFLEDSLAEKIKVNDANLREQVVPANVYKVTMQWLTVVLTGWPRLHGAVVQLGVDDGRAGRARLGQVRAGANASRRPGPQEPPLPRGDHHGKHTWALGGGTYFRLIKKTT